MNLVRVSVVRLVPLAYAFWVPTNEPHELYRCSTHHQWDADGIFLRGCGWSLEAANPR